MPLLPSRMGNVRGQLSFRTLTLAVLTCALLESCTAARTPGTALSATGPRAQPPTSGPHSTGPPGSPGDPLVLACTAESWPGYPARASTTPGPHDLAVGPMYFADGLALATETPAQHGYTTFGRDGRSYKFGVVVRPGATVTVTIAASARGHAVIDIGRNAPGGATAVTYHACGQAGGFYAQGFAFIHPPFRGCVPLDVSTPGQAQVRHVVLSLFAGSCASTTR
jgi:hypothetical protein